MNARASIERQNEQPDLRRGIVQRMVQVVVTLLVQMAILFGAAGRLDWPMAWALMAVYVAFLLINATVLVRKDPALVVERGRVKEDAKTWDKWLAAIMSLFGPLAALLVTGLDKRNGWSAEYALAIQLAALIAVIVGYALWGWAMASNTFFSGLVRIQKERGHTVASGGPYRYVRHPGYVGLIVFSVGTPLALGSLWGLVPAGFAVLMTIVRTALEDRTLQEELPGYRDYAGRVRYRLLPGIW
jgi:protein-S-isoprenylcysteine O-methyltransferase Ste14